MEEFKFFGNKGRLKNVTEVIEERVKERIEEEKKVKEIFSRIKKLEQKLNNVNESNGDVDEKIKKYRQFALDMLKKYKNISMINAKLSKELSELRDEKRIKARVNAAVTALEKQTRTKD